MIKRFVIVGGCCGRIVANIAKSLALASLSVATIETPVAPSLKIGIHPNLWPCKEKGSRPWYHKQRNGKPARF
jgi:hypothetical protein